LQSLDVGTKARSQPQPEARPSHPSTATRGPRSGSIARSKTEPEGAHRTGVRLVI
jgi:hypothetical protein